LKAWRARRRRIPVAATGADRAVGGGRHGEPGDRTGGRLYDRHRIEVARALCRKAACGSRRDRKAGRRAEIHGGDGQAHFGAAGSTAAPGLCPLVRATPGRGARRRRCPVCLALPARPKDRPFRAQIVVREQRSGVRRQAADVVGLYMAPPENAIVICVDEKPSIQALEREQGYLKLPNGRAGTHNIEVYRRLGAALEWLKARTLTLSAPKAIREMLVLRSRPPLVPPCPSRACARIERQPATVFSSAHESYSAGGRRAFHTNRRFSWRSEIGRAQLIAGSFCTPEPVAAPIANRRLLAIASCEWIWGVIIELRKTHDTMWDFRRVVNLTYRIAVSAITTVRPQPSGHRATCKDRGQAHSR
jgi:hypothetical protein